MLHHMQILTDKISHILKWAPIDITIISSSLWKTGTTLFAVLLHNSTCTIQYQLYIVN